jgi:hypothetical protein
MEKRPLGAFFIHTYVVGYIIHRITKLIPSSFPDENAILLAEETLCFGDFLAYFGKR